MLKLYSSWNLEQHRYRNVGNTAAYAHLVRATFVPDTYMVTRITVTALAPFTQRLQKERQKEARPWSPTTERINPDESTWSLE